MVGNFPISLQLCIYGGFVNDVNLTLTHGTWLGELRSRSEENQKLREKRVK